METHIMREWKILVMLVVVLRSEVVNSWREEGRPRMVVDYLNQHAGKLNINLVKNTAPCTSFSLTLTTVYGYV